jgi:hypothetical protein
MRTLDSALRQFEATEANLQKLEKLWEQIHGHLSQGLAFGSPPEYEELCLAFRDILPALPAIDGYRVEDRLHEYDTIGSMRLNALEVGEIDAQFSVENEIEEQGRYLRKYRFRLNTKRRALVRGRMLKLIDEVDALLRIPDPPDEEEINSTFWESLKESVAEIDSLLGSAARPQRWGDLNRHIHFSSRGDKGDIQEWDWPAVKNGLRSALYGQHEPVPVEVDELSELVAASPQGRVTTKLDWSALSDEDFERLIFLIISETEGYENPEWLQQTYAADRGRDLSVTRIDLDPLAGVRRHRIIIQCKHWQTKSVGVADISILQSQMILWQPPRVDGLVIATTGRFTADAIVLVEQNNQADRALHISMWPDSHLERLLAARPHLIAQFGLRR